MTRPPHEDVLARLDILTQLVDFNPHVAGTPPLGIDLPTSDIDIICHAPDPDHFAATLWATARHQPNFTLHQWTQADRPVIARFSAEGWPIEIYGSTQPIDRQAGWRHFMIERRLLDMGGVALRKAVMAARWAGLKTEPAFAHCLALPGDPYAALLLLEEADDRALSSILHKCGFPRG